LSLEDEKGKSEYGNKQKFLTHREFSPTVYSFRGFLSR
jgi:hypothetical protein